MFFSSYADCTYVARFMPVVLHGFSIPEGDTMPKVIEDTLPPLSDEELAFEMIDITSDEIGDLTTLFEMMTSICEEMATEIVEENLPEQLEESEGVIIH